MPEKATSTTTKAKTKGQKAAPKSKSKSSRSSQTTRPMTPKTAKKSPESASGKRPRLVKRVWSRAATRVRNFLRRRPHRSFRLTRRRDYVRSLMLPGYWAFTAYVYGTLRRHKRLFVGMAVFYALLGVVVGNMTSQETYDHISELFREGGQDVFEGSWGTIGQAMLLSLAAINGGSQGLTEVQQVYAALLFLLIWLTTIWLLREILAGGKPKLRDGLYSASSPLISTLLVLAALLVQLLPVGVLVVVFSALSSIGVISAGFGAFLFSIVAVLVLAMTLYWITSTFIALIVVALPGMYPMQALRIAGDLIIGRRLRVLYRLLWLAGTIIVPWFVIMTPIILLDSWLRSIASWYAVVPLAPVAAMLLGALSTVWACSYIYLLYRKVVDDDSAPA